MSVSADTRHRVSCHQAITNKNIYRYYQIFRKQAKLSPYIVGNRNLINIYHYYFYNYVTFHFLVTFLQRHLSVNDFFKPLSAS